MIRPMGFPGAALRALWRQTKSHPLSGLGPGLITGVADDDPSGIATYSQAGAQFGLNMLWTMPLAFPLMAAVQLMCARIGRVTGKGLAANIKAVFPMPVLRAAVVLVLLANTLNIAADVASMGEVSELVTGIDRHLMTVLLTLGSLALQIWVPYHRYVVYLKWLALSLLAYFAVLFVIHVPVGTVLLRTLWPQIRFDSATATMVMGVLGTTISPYLFFWQASEEVEEMQAHPGQRPLLVSPKQAHDALRRIDWDTWSGMFYSDLTAYVIILVTGLTLHAAGLTDIQTASQAAAALKPIAGNFAGTVFAAGVVGVGLIGVPVLAGSAGYALAEAMDWPFGLERQAKEARGFYGIIAAAMIIGVLLQYSPISPMHALFWSAVINGLVAVPLMVVITLLATRKSVMGAYTVSRTIAALAWLATALMGLAATVMFIGA